MLKILALASLLLIFATASRAENLAFVGRTQNTADASYTSITVSTPAGIQSGDVMLVFIASWNATPMAPSGWTSLGSASNPSYEIGAAFMKVWQTGDSTSYTFGNVNWPKAIMRVYRGVTGADSSNFAASGVRASSLTIPALPATTAADDVYVAFFVSDEAKSISGSSDLADQMADQAQWGSFDGDKVILNQGTKPPAEAAVLSSGTGNWIGFVITLANHPANLSFVGRTQNTANAPSTSITVSTPAGIQSGDVMLVFVASWNAKPTAPTGWISLGSVASSNSDVGAAFLKVWQSGNPISYTFGNVNWPKAIMRVYRGVTAADSSGLAATTGGAASSLTIPALQATSVANEEYVGFFAQENAASTISVTPSLGNQTVDHTQWGSFDGDSSIAASGTIPPAETGSISISNNWVGLAITLGNNPVQASACTSSVCPYCTVGCTSNTIRPPSGQKWYTTLDDEFANGTPGGATNGINMSLWNAGPGGGDPVGITCALGLPCTTAQYFGNAFDSTNTPAAPYIGIKPGVGLIVQDLNDYTVAGQGNGVGKQAWMSLQNYGKQNQIHGYWEVSAKMPTDYAGEGDGLHTDIWLVPNCRFSTPWGRTPECDAEFDLTENALGTGNTNQFYTSLVENDALIYQQQTLAGSNLSQAFHRYGLYWRNDGTGTCGSFQMYFDGQPIAASPTPANDPAWCQSMTVNGVTYPAGTYLFAGWLQQVGLGAFWGGADVDQYTSNNNPLIIQYVRVWQSH